MIQDTTNIFNTPTRQINGKVELLSGSTLAATFAATDVLQEITIERLGDKGKFFGFGTCQKMQVKLVDKERAITIDKDNGLKPYFSSGGEFVSAFPTFYAEEVKRDENTNGLTITAYDALYRANKLTFADLGLEAPYGDMDVANACASALGLSGVKTIDTTGNTVLDTIALFGRGINAEGTEKLRDILNALAEYTGSIYYVDKDNYLTFKRYPIVNDEGYYLVIDKADYFTLTSNKNRRFKTVISTNDLGNSISASIPDEEAEGETQYIRNNPFIEAFNEDNQVIVLRNIVNSYYSMFSMQELDLEWRGNFLLEYGDEIVVKSKDNKWITSYLLNDTITYNGGFNQKTSWSYEADNGETASNPATLGEALKQTYAKVDKVNKQIEILASEVNSTNAEISQLKLDTGSIVASVESTQKTVKETADSLADEITTINEKVSATMTSEEINIAIQKSIDNGASQVNTATGFTFNADGLKVAKEGSEISTQITEDGMTVNKDNKEVLTANNKGVTAIDLKATTYLIVGDNSRFENYGSTRTGCFWIGG